VDTTATSAEGWSNEGLGVVPLPSQNLFFLNWFHGGAFSCILITHFKMFKT